MGQSFSAFKATQQWLPGTALSRHCLELAVAALGLKTSFQPHALAGWRPFMRLVAWTVWMAAFVRAALQMR